MNPPNLHCFDCGAPFPVGGPGAYCTISVNGHKATTLICMACLKVRESMDLQNQVTRIYEDACREGILKREANG